MLGALMIHKRPETPQLDPKTLGLPRSPTVTSIDVRPFVNAAGEEGLEVTVHLTGLTPDQERDLDWTKGIERRIRDELESMGDERFPLILYRTPNDEIPASESN
jgi:hypothetical protein